MNEWLKLPGLFHRSELEQGVEVDRENEYVFEQTGHDTRGRKLIAVYCRARPLHDDISSLERLIASNADNEGGVL